MKCNLNRKNNTVAHAFLDSVFDTKKSVYEVARWAKEHADFLEYFENYDHEKVRRLMEGYLGMAFTMSTKERELREANEDPSELIAEFKHLTKLLIIDMELNCR